MSFTDTLTIVYQTPAGIVANQQYPYVGNTEQNVDAACNANVNVTLIVKFGKAALQSLLLYSDQTITLLTNSNSSPQDTINLKANVAYPWNGDLGSVYACPFSNNVNAFVVVASSVNVNAVVNFKFRSVQNN